MPVHDSKTLQTTEERTDEKIGPPPQYRVLIHNDDFTTKVFVIELLVAVFHKSLDAAATLMWHIHHHGYGVAGVYPLEIAETKVNHATTLARANEFPLKLSIEKE
jgi:ATP-dependent Clp protease adaptor protein ClpS